MTDSKVTPFLAQRLSQAKPLETLDVIVEFSLNEPYVDCSASRQEKMSSLQHAFYQAIKPTELVIEAGGGVVIERAWINQTVWARVSGPCIQELSKLNEVVALDVPRAIRPDVK
jgi:hypothetical protein